MNKGEESARANIGSLSESRVKACLGNLKCIVLNLVIGFLDTVFNLLFWTFALQIFFKICLNFPCAHVCVLPSTVTVIDCYKVAIEGFKLITAQPVFNWCIAFVLQSLHSSINFVLFFFFLWSFLFAFILLRLLLVQEHPYAAWDNEWEQKR